MSQPDTCGKCGRTWQAHEDEALARLAADFPFVFDGHPWGDDDKRINEQMIEDALTRTDWVSASKPVLPKPTSSQIRGEQDSPTDAQLSYAMDQAHSALSDEAAPRWLRLYYKPDGGYASNTVLTVEPNDPWRITATDLYAISLLNVKVGPRAARRIPEVPENQEALSRALQQLPLELDLITATDEAWRGAERFYWLVKPLLGTNAWVTTSKLCARKRPRFFPVRDSVVTVNRLRGGVSPVTDWSVYRHLMADQVVQDRLRTLTEARADQAVILDPPLKVLDVLLWMSTMEQLRTSRNGMSVA